MDSPSIRRILVALDASPHSLAALAAAVELSVKLQAELLGLFVEDVDLLRLASSPYARGLLLPSAKDMAVDFAAMEREFKAHAELARRALAAAAERANVKWAFRTVRGSVPSEILAAAAACDLIALGWRGWSLKKPQVGSTAAASARQTIPVLLLSAGNMHAERPVLVWFDGTSESKRAVLAAADLASLRSHKLTVLLPPAGSKSAEGLQQQVENLLTGKELQLVCRHVPDLSQESLLGILRSIHPGMIVLTGKEPFPQPALLLARLDALHISALLLGESSLFALQEG